MIAAIDMDDTLLRTDKSISPATLQVLDAWLAKDRRVVIATGRPPRRIVDSLPSALQGLPWVAYNGAIAADAGDEIVLRDFIPVADTQEILRLIMETIPTITLGLEIDDVIYFNRPVETIVGEVVEDLLSVAVRPAAKILFTLDDFAPMQALAPRLPASTRLMLSEKYRLVQIMSATADKAHGLRYLIERWGYGMAQVVAFGDDTNDVGMVQASGIGVAVENAVPEVLAVADHVTRSNNADGVAHALAALLDATHLVESAPNRGS
jgi:Cof subfamily protein (haloacid dehalogenase superfamily)